MSRKLLGLVLPLVLLGLWQTVTAAGWYEPSQLPLPGDVLAAVRELLAKGELWQHFAISMQRVFWGYLIGALLAVAVGAVVGLSAITRTMVAPTIEVFRTVPSLAWVPLLLLWLGIGEEPKIVLVAIGAFFPVYTTTASGLAHVDPQLVEVGRAYGLSGPRLFWTVQLPAAASSILNGLRLGLVYGWLFLVAAELIAASSGLGFLLIDSQNSGRTDVMILSIALLALLGKTSDLTLAAAERRVAATRR